MKKFLFHGDPFSENRFELLPFVSSGRVYGSLIDASRILCDPSGASAVVVISSYKESCIAYSERLFDAADILLGG